jgi:hypothetical protein
MPSGAPEHFICMFLMASFVILIVPKGFKALILTLLTIIILGGSKEIYDYCVNRWSLSHTDLLNDCIRDMWWDLMGGIVGIVFGAFMRLRG